MRLHHCTCAHCGKEFYGRVNDGQVSIYCSRKCHFARNYANNHLNYLKQAIASLNDDPTKQWSEYPCLIWPYSTVDGYGNVAIKKKRFYAHRISYVLTYGDTDLFVCHSCDVRRCFRPIHLFAGTQAENIADMVAKGRHLIGERNHATKLSRTDVAGIREMAARGVPQSEIGEHFRTTQTNVGCIVRRVTWKHI